MIAYMARTKTINSIKAANIVAAWNAIAHGAHEVSFEAILSGIRRSANLGLTYEIPVGEYDIKKLANEIVNQYILKKRAF